MIHRVLLLVALATAAQATDVSSSVLPEPSSHHDAVMRLAGIRPLFEYAADTSPGCSYWHDDFGDLTCQELPEFYFISPAEWNHWNPSVGASCQGWISGRSYCVASWDDLPPPPPVTTTTARTTSTATTTPRVTTTTTPPTRTTTTMQTTTTAGNGIQTPQPTQLTIVANCDRFELVNAGDTCAAIAAKHSISLQQFITWNPSVGSTCTGLWANAYACVRTIGFQAPPPTTTTRVTTTTTTTRGNGITTPQPTQPGMVSNCDRFHMVTSGQTCAIIGARNGITASRFASWNSLTSSCSGLWANANACVRTIGFVPSSSVSCSSASGDKPWGDNRPAALNNVKSWCDGNANTDGVGNYAIAQTKRGCYNAPLGTNKIEFTARNDFGAPATMSTAKCEELMRQNVERCANGGTGTQEGWWFKAVVVAGRC